MAQLDAQVPYLTQILGFIGITDVSIVYADSLGGSDVIRQSSLDQALAETQGAGLEVKPGDFFEVMGDTQKASYHNQHDIGQRLQSNLTFPNEN